MAEVSALVIQIQATAEGLETALGGALQSIQRFAEQVQTGVSKISFATVENAIENTGEKVKELGNNTQDEGKKMEAAWDTIGKAAKSALKDIVQAVDRGIAAYQSLEFAMMGLQSVAGQSGIGPQAMQTALDKVGDAFLDSASAATAFKNLLTRGFSLDQATNMILRLKESAAFGRQANQSLAQSVVAATEGIKNENNALVSNAGVTKTVAKMWQDYAKARGLVSNELTQAQKVEAEYLGVMEATAKQVADFGKMSQTLAGDQAKAAQQSLLAAQNFGEAMAPVTAMGEQIKGGLLEGLNQVLEAFPGVTAGATTATTSFLAMASAASTLAKVPSLLTTIGLTSSTLLPLAGVAVVIGVIVGAYTALAKNQEERARAEQERIAKLKESVSSEKIRMDRLDEIEKRYKELNSQTSLSLSDSAELSALRKELADVYGIEATQVGNAAAAHFKLAKAIEEEKRASAKKTYDEQSEITQNAKNKAIETSLPLLKQVEAIEDRLNILTGGRIDLSKKADQSTLATIASLAGLKTSTEELGRVWLRNMDGTGKADVGSLAELMRVNESEIEYIQSQKFASIYVAHVQAEVDEAKGKLAALVPDFNDWFIQEFLLKGMALEEQGVEVPTDLMNAFVNAIVAGFDENMIAQFEGMDSAGIEAAIQSNFLEVFAKAAQNPGFLDAANQFRELTAQAVQGMLPDEDQKTALAKSWEELFGTNSTILQSLNDMTAAFGEEGALTIINDFVNGLLGLPQGFEMFIGAGQMAIPTAEAMAQALEEQARQAEVNKTALANATDSLAEMRQVNDKLEHSLFQSKGLAENAKRLKTVVDAYKDLSKEAKKNPAEIEKVNQAAKVLGMTFDGSQKSLERVEKGLESFTESLQQQAVTAEVELEQLKQDFESLDNMKDVHGNLTVDGEAMAKEIADREQELLALKALLQLLGFNTGSGADTGRRSGGSKKKSKSELAEEARRAAEEARQEAIRQDYALLEHQKHLNQLTLEQELAMLHQIRDAHALNAKEIMEWEQKVYDVRQELRRRDADSIDKAGNALIDALGARYQAMQEAEIQRLDASRKAWEDWRDDSVKAIRDQIAALDELSKTEDREKQDQEELRKIAKLRQDVEFEQDSYNRMKLQQQLDQAISAREDRLRRLAVEDQKAALQKQIEAIQDQAEAQFTALDGQQAEIEKAYAERMKTAALRAEAEKLLMTGNQQEIISLLGEFAPEYDALGKTLGEKLLEGFQSKVGSVVSWFQSLNDSLYAIQERAASQAVAAANAFQSGYQERQQGSAAANAAPPTVVNQTVNFNEPVESAGEAAKRVRQANEELGALLYGG